MEPDISSFDTRQQDENEAFYRPGTIAVIRAAMRRERDAIARATLQNRTENRVKILLQFSHTTIKRIFTV